MGVKWAKIAVLKSAIIHYFYSIRKRAYTVIGVEGSSIAARRASYRIEVCRDATHFKLTKNFPVDKHSWREKLLGRMRNRDRSTTNQEPTNQPMVRRTDQTAENYIKR